MSGIVLFLLIVIGVAAVFGLVSLLLILNEMGSSTSGGDVVFSSICGVFSLATILLSFLAIVDPAGREDVEKVTGGAIMCGLVALATFIAAIVICIRAWWRSGQDKRRARSYQRMLQELAER